LGLIDSVTVPKQAPYSATKIDTKSTSTPEEVIPTETVDLESINFDIESLLKEEQTNDQAIPTTTQSAPSQQNRLIVPRMGVDAQVFDGSTQQALSKGLWHIPGSAVPSQNGNIVISAHRWLYKPPNPKTFYLIDKMQIGDPIYYDYHASRYTYKVTKIFIVNPDDVHILKQDENKLTLFTCTPLYSTKQRQVVVAELISVDDIAPQE
jgi:sortase A